MMGIVILTRLLASFSGLLGGLLSLVRRPRHCAPSYPQDLASSVYINPNSLTLSWPVAENETSLLEVQWAEVLSVYAFKADCFAIDQIRLAVYLTDQRCVEVTENMNGWDELLKKLPEYLSGCKPESEWWAPVAFPPFEPNVTLLYQRHDQSAG